MFIYFWIPNTLFTGLRVSLRSRSLNSVLMAAHELDDLDCSKQLRTGEHYGKLWGNGFQPDLDS